jgi:hypothetical protein
VTIIACWLRLELRRRWRSLAVLALLVAVAGATVMAALAGARRGASAQQRLDERTLPASAAILANTPGFDWKPIRRLPEIAAMTNFAVDYNMTPIGFSGDGLSFPHTDHEIMRTIERPVIFEGRALNPDRADEVDVTREFVKYHHKSIGDTVEVVLATPKEILAQDGSGPNHTYTGPRVTLHIVGVGELSSRWGVDQPGAHGGVLLSPGLYDKYPQNIVGPPGRSLNYVNALVRLHGGEAALPQLSKDLTRITGRSDIDILNLVQGERDAQHHIAFESRCLLAFGIAAFVAALFLVGQAIARYAAASTEELQTVRALGLTPVQSVAAAVAGPALMGVVAAVAAVIGAVLASQLLPFGTAGLMEPSPGISWDWVIFGPGLAVIIGSVAAGAAIAAAFAVAAARRDRPVRRSTVATTMNRSRLPVPIVIGIRFALESGRGRTAVPVRPALLGSVMGVLGVVAAFTFSHGVSDAAAHPERFGQTFQLGAFIGINGHDFGPADRLITALQHNADVSGVDDARTAVATQAGGDTSVSIYAYSTGAKAIPVVILDGRLPESEQEVVLAPKTMSALHTHIGAQVTLTGQRTHPATFTVVGAGLVPQGPHNGYADGGWLTQHGYDRLFTGFKFHIVLVTLRPGARGHGAGAALTASLVKADKRLQDFQLDQPDPIPEVALLREVRKLPIFLGAFLAFLAVGAVGHALATAVRRRSHDLAVLRAVGMTQWQCRWAVVTQATVLALVGAAFGIPLGLAVGRTVWRIVADYTPIEYVPPTALWTLALVGPAALVLANLLAAWPGHRAARLRVAHVLRAE